MSAFEDDEPRVVELLDEEDDDFKDCTEGPQNKTVTNPDESTTAEQETETTVKVDREEDDETAVPPPPTFILPKDIQKALEAKEAGNEYFRQKDYDNAIQCYSNAIAYCPNDAENKEYHEQLATFYGNRAAAYFAEEDYELVIDDCSYALDYKPDYVKVLIRRMQSYEKLDKLEEALSDAKKIQELDPSTPKIQATV